MKNYIQSQSSYKVINGKVVEDSEENIFFNNDNVNGKYIKKNFGQITDNRDITYNEFTEYLRSKNENMTISNLMFLKALAEIEANPEPESDRVTDDDTESVDTQSLILLALPLLENVSDSDEKENEDSLYQENVAIEDTEDVPPLSDKSIKVDDNNINVEDKPIDSEEISVPQEDEPIEDEEIEVGDVNENKDDSDTEDEEIEVGDIEKNESDTDTETIDTQDLVDMAEDLFSNEITGSESQSIEPGITKDKDMTFTENIIANNEEKNEPRCLEIEKKYNLTGSLDEKKTILKNLFLEKSKELTTTQNEKDILDSWNIFNSDYTYYISTTNCS